MRSLFYRPVPILKSFRWLRFIFKICATAYEALSSAQPRYLILLFSPARRPRQLLVGSVRAGLTGLVLRVW